MKTVLLILSLLSVSFGLDTLTNKELNFSIVFPKTPSVSIKENSDTYGPWVNTNYTAYESHTKRTTSLIVKDYRKYDQTGTSGEAIVIVTTNLMLKQFQAKKPFELTLMSETYDKAYSWSTESVQKRLHIKWHKGLLYIVIIEEPHTVGVSLLDEFPGSFKILN